MPTQPLPENPSLDNLRKQAKQLRKDVAAPEAAAVARVREFHPRPDDALRQFALNDAQLVIARSHGFPSWARLKAHVADVAPHFWLPPKGTPDSAVDQFLQLACLTYGRWHRSYPAKARDMLAADPDLSRTNVYTAAAVGDVTTARAMIDREPQLVTAKGGALKWEPLLYACYSRFNGTDPRLSTLEVARLLLARGADPNAGFLWDGRYAYTALTGAFGEGEDRINEPPHAHRDELATLLLEAGADPNDSQALYNRHFRDDDSHLQLLFAYGLGRDRGGPWLKRLPDQRITPARLLVEELWSAAKNNFPRRVELLVTHGVDLNATGLRDGRTPYETALRAGHTAIAEALLRHGAHRVELDPVETFALACIGGRRDEAYARLRVDPALLERMGHHARVDMLHRALVARHPGALQLIVDLGVDINGLVPGTGLDRSVLHEAAMWGDVELVRQILALGGDPQLRDPTYHGKPIGWAAHFDRHAVVELLLPFATIFDAVQVGNVERADERLRADPSLAHALDEDGDPLAFYLNPEIKRLPEMIRTLRTHGVDLDARSTRGKTALDMALAYGWTDVAATLREYGAQATS